MAKFTIGLDYGTNSVRALIVNVANGAEVGAAVWNYAHGEQGILLDPRQPDLARQHPADYVAGIEHTVRGALAAAQRVKGFAAADVIGIGVDTTGSTPLPVDPHGAPLAFNKKFAKTPAAMAWLWKDHTGHAEAAAITRQAARRKPEYLAKCGGTYSSEWFWSKILHAKKEAPAVLSLIHI